MRYILLVVLVLMVSGCSHFSGNRINPVMKSKDITIKIDDSHNNEQYYSIQLMTNGKESKKMAALPQSKSLITDNKKRVKVKVIENVPYTITVYKSEAKSVTDSPKITEPLAEVKFTPSTDSDNLKINVNPNF